MVKVKHTIGKGKRKKEIKFHYRVKSVIGNKNKKLPNLTTRKKWSDSVGRESYKILVQMVEEHKGSYKEICCIDGTYHI